MYNRYIPQPDGSFTRNRVPDPTRHRPTQKPPAPPKQDTCPPKPPEPVCPPPKKEPCAQKPRQEGSVGGFLRQLLPKDFDTGDLMVVLLLLLMAGDCEEDRNNALLTLALYFMM